MISRSTWCLGISSGEWWIPSSWDDCLKHLGLPTTDSRLGYPAESACCHCNSALPESQNSVIPEQLQTIQQKILSNYFQPIVWCTFHLLSLKVVLERMCKPYSTWGQEYRAASFPPSVGWIRYCSYAWSWNPIRLRTIQFKTDVDSKVRDKSASQ